MFKVSGAKVVKVIIQLLYVGREDLKICNK